MDDQREPAAAEARRAADDAAVDELLRRRGIKRVAPENEVPEGQVEVILVAKLLGGRRPVDPDEPRD